MRSERARARGELVIVSHKHAAFSGGQRLDRMETKGRHVGPGMGALTIRFPVSFKASASSVAGVFYDDGATLLLQ